MNQQINNNNQVSIYIPRMSINITESVVMEIFRTSNIGEVNRVDFTQINKKTGFIENNHNNNVYTISVPSPLSVYCDLKVGCCTILPVKL